MPNIVTAAIVAAAVLLHSSAYACESCAGDRDASGSVTVDEVLQSVSHALIGCPQPPERCHGDSDCDGVVVVSEILLAVNNALIGCPTGADLVVDVDWLQAHLDDENLQILDARTNGYRGGHVPRALPLSPYQLATTVGGVPFQSLSPEPAAELLADLGIRNDSTIVVYGVPPEIDSARVVWALRYYGLHDVRYLDGGWNEWLASSSPVASGSPEPGESTRFAATVEDRLRVSGEWILDRLGEAPYAESDVQLVDARSPAEFAAGHIPTAVNADWTDNLEVGFLKPEAELRGMYAALDLDPNRTTVAYCTAGWRASVTWLALTWLGFEDVRVYDGSWLEWANDDRFPVATGE